MPLYAYSTEVVIFFSIKVITWSTVKYTVTSALSLGAELDPCITVLLSSQAEAISLYSVLIYQTLITKVLQ
jgi:hypothetical protein